MSRSPPSPLLVLHRVSRSFAAGAPGCTARVQALRSASLSLRAGEVVLLAGGPGAGKTTLLLCAAGLLRPDAGMVVPRAARAIAFVPGAPVFAGYLRLVDAIALHVRGSPAYAAAALHLAGALALGDLHRRRVASLSRAELHRLAAACALGASPSVLLLDAAPPEVSPAEDPLLLRAVHALARRGMGAIIGSRDAAAPAGQVRTVLIEAGVTRLPGACGDAPPGKVTATPRPMVTSPAGAFVAER